MNVNKQASNNSRYRIRWFLCFSQHFEIYLMGTDCENVGRVPWGIESSDSITCGKQVQLFRLSDSRLSEKLVPNFADRGSHVVSMTDPYARIRGF
jgi:hypothetical protein